MVDSIVVHCCCMREWQNYICVYVSDYCWTFSSFHLHSAAVMRACDKFSSQILRISRRQMNVDTKLSWATAINESKEKKTNRMTIILTVYFMKNSDCALVLSRNLFLISGGIQSTYWQYNLFAVINNTNVCCLAVINHEHTYIWSVTHVRGQKIKNQKKKRQWIFDASILHAFVSGKTSINYKWKWTIFHCMFAYLFVHESGIIFSII